MGKKQHSKDRMFITRTEWNTEWGGYKEKKTSKRVLPFYCCALSLQPFEHPYCTKDGYVFDLTAILPYVKKHKTHPITGHKLSVKDLIKLTFHKNDDEQLHCPITRKIFNASSYIVAIATTGHVYSYEAIKELNLKKNDFRDLLDNVPFSSATDIITIQDPQNPSKQHIENFAHIARSITTTDTDDKEDAALKIDHHDADDDEQASRSTYLNPEVVTSHAQVRHTAATKRVFAEIVKEANTQAAGPPRKKSKKSTHQHHDALQRNEDNAYGLYNAYTTGKMAASFTSTAMPAVFKDELQPFTAEQIRMAKWHNVKGNSNKKGYVQMVTNMGNLNILLHCDLVPKTCYNFLVHCENGYYNDTVFHRSIASFMIQGGDPKGNGRGGECAWSTPNGKFEDEFHKLLKHEERGVLAMANSGADTNASQFYILYQPQSHLDDKHSVFGRVVGGLAVLNRMEESSVDEHDRPLRAITILKTNVYRNPFNDPLPNQIKAEQEQKAEELRKLEQQKGRWWSNTAQETIKFTNNNKGDNATTTTAENEGVVADNPYGIGKYLKNKKLLQSRYGSTQKLENNNKKQERKKCVLPFPKTKNDSTTLDNQATQSQSATSKSVFRFKNFETTNK